MKPIKLIVLLCFSSIILGSFGKNVISENNFFMKKEITEDNFSVEENNKCIFFDDKFNKKIEHPYFDKNNRPEPKIIGNLQYS